MPKVILEFIVPEENEELKLAQRGPHLDSAITEFDNYLRGKLKYEVLDEATEAIYHEVRTKLWECLNDE